MTKNGNLGIGGYDLPERAYTNEQHIHNLRIQEVGPLGRRFFINTRVNLTWMRTSSVSVLEAPTIRVNDAFVSGVSSSRADVRQAGGTLLSDLDYVRGIHSVRTGLAVDFFSYQSDITSNYLGTYTFASLAAYKARRPTSYTRRVGDPEVSYRNVQGGVYVQDDIRVRRNLTVSPGIRYELQSRLDDYNNVGPRFGVTWAPFPGGKTTIQASLGLFYDWLSTSTVEQAIHVDGLHQLELNIPDPSFPDPGNLVEFLPRQPVPPR